MPQRARSDLSRGRWFRLGWLTTRGFGPRAHEPGEIVSFFKAALGIAGLVRTLAASRAQRVLAQSAAPAAADETVGASPDSSLTETVDEAAGSNIDSPHRDGSTVESAESKASPDASSSQQSGGGAEAGIDAEAAAGGGEADLATDDGVVGDAEADNVDAAADDDPADPADPDTQPQGTADERKRRRLGEPRIWLVGVAVIAIVTAVTTDYLNPAVNATLGLIRTKILNEHPLPSPDAQMNHLAAEINAEGYTAISDNVKFNYGPQLTVMVLTPDASSRGTRPSQLRVYAVPGHGKVQQLFRFTPKLLMSRTQRDAGGPIGGMVIPRALDINVRSVGHFNGTPGLQVLLDLYDPQLPVLEEAPLLLTEQFVGPQLATPRFVLQPLLSPASLKDEPMARMLSKRYFAGGNWAQQVQTGLYDVPLHIENSVTDTTLETYTVLQYAYSSTPTQGSPGVLTMAAGYAARGGNFPTPDVMQILVYRIDLTGAAPIARTFAGIPDFVRLPPSASATQIENQLTNAANGLPASMSPTP